MKRILSLFLCLFLISGLFIQPAHALFGGGIFSGGGVVIYDNDDSRIEHFTVLDGKVYAFRSGVINSVFLYNLEDKSENPLFELDPEFSLSKLYHKDGKLYMLGYDGKQMVYNPADGKLEKAADLPLSQDENYINNLHYVDGQPVLQVDSMNGEGSFLYWLDGSEKKMPLPRDRYFNSLSSYKDGKFIGLSFDGLYLVSEGKAEKLNLEEVMVFESGAFFYEAKSDTLYLSVGNFLYTINEQLEKTTVGFLPYIIENYSPWLYSDGKLYYIQDEEENNTLASLSLDALELPTSLLRVAGLDTRLANAYNKAYPESPIATTGYLDWTLSSDPAKLANSMKGEDAAAVYFLDNSQMRFALSKHGYAESFASNEALMALHNRLYPYIKEGMEHEGNPYFLPFELNLLNTGFSYRVDALEELGYTEEDLPKTYLEFAKFCKELEEKTEDGEFQLFRGESTVNLKLMLTSNYITELYASQLRAGEKIEFNHPDSIKLLQEIYALQFDRLNNGESIDYGMLTDDFDKAALIELNQKIAGLLKGYKLLPIALKEGQEPLILVSPRVAFVNSLSPKKAEGLDFLARFAGTLSEDIQTLLYTDKTEPVQDSNLLKYIENQEKRLAESKELIAQISDEKERKAMEQDLEWEEKDLENSRKNTYLISEEDLAYYKANAANYYILSQEFLNFSNEQQMSLMGRFYNNQIDVVTFLNELDRIINMALLEGK